MAESAQCPCPEPEDENRETEMKNSESEKTSPQMDAGGQSTDPKPEGAPKESPEVKGASIPDNPGPSPDIEMDAGGQSTDPQGDKPEGAPKESPEEKGASIPDDPGPSPDIEMDTGGQSTDPQGDKPEDATKESPEEKGASMGHESGRRPFNIKSEFRKEVLLDHLKGVIYGNCIGDAIGLLTEFMTKEEAKRIYVDKKHPGSSKKEKVTTWMKAMVGCPRPDLEYSMKHNDGHRYRWETGDWTDDSDQMILILQTLLNNDGKMVATDFAIRLKKWSKEGFVELDDEGGMGIGRTTSFVLRHPEFKTDPHKAAEYVWETSGRTVAPNGGVMRTSILGTHDFGNIDKVIENTVIACKVTHADPRCIASCVAVTTAIAMMLQGKRKHWTKSDGYNVKEIIKDAYDYASSTLETEDQKGELKSYMNNESLEWLKLDEPGKIGYTYKCMGAGFWSLRQKNFRESLEAITFEGGDADTNGAVAGALLGCKLGAHALPPSWLEGLKHKNWLDKLINRYRLELLGLSESEAKEIDTDIK